MSAEVEKKEEVVEPNTAPKKGFKGLLEIAEVKMLLYVIPVALVLLVVALLLGNK